MVAEGSGRSEPVIVDGETLTAEKVALVARSGAQAELSRASRDAMGSSRASLERMIQKGSTVYAVNTGVGDLVSSVIPKKDVKALQLNLLRSHACGVGEPYPEEVSRAMMLLRANSLAKGLSGVRPELVELLIDMINEGKVDLLINTPIYWGSAATEARIRSAAVMHNIPLVTTMAGARAAVQAIHALRQGTWSVKALQDYYQTPAG